MADGTSVIPFGKYNGKTIEDIPSGYLRWCAEQDWVEKKHPLLLAEMELELAFRDKFDTHFEEVK